MTDRYVVYIPNHGFLVGAVRLPRWSPRSIGTFARSPDPQAARVFHRKADAERNAKASGGEVLKVMLWYGPHSPHSKDWRE